MKKKILLLVACLFSIGLVVAQTNITEVINSSHGDPLEYEINGFDQNFTNVTAVFLPDDDFVEIIKVSEKIPFTEGQITVSYGQIQLVRHVKEVKSLVAAYTLAEQNLTEGISSQTEISLKETNLTRLLTISGTADDIPIVENLNVTVSELDREAILHTSINDLGWICII